MRPYSAPPPDLTHATDGGEIPDWTQSQDMPETQAAYERLWEMVVEHAVQGRPVKLRLPDDRLEMRRLKMRIREQVVRCIMAARRPWSLHSQPAWDSRHWLLWLTEWAPE